MQHRMSGDTAPPPERPASTLENKLLPGQSTSEAHLHTYAVYA